MIKKRDHGKIKRGVKKIIRKPIPLRQLKMLQTQLEQTGKMALLGQMTAGFAHDIKNPLNLMISFADLSLEQTKEFQTELQTERNLTLEKMKNIERFLDFLEQNLQKIKEHGNRIDSLVKSMLLQSQGKKGIFQWVDINELLEENISMIYGSMRYLGQSFDIKIDTDLDITIGKVKIVPQDFSRAFLNIVNNAYFSVNEKRKQAAPDFLPLIAIKSRNLGKTIEIRILDNGMGIPQKDKNKLFTPLFTTKPAGLGTGLGLGIANEIIQQHKGNISIKSEEGEYAEFIITIPKA
ncbi:MAG TPA: HAMP domain-containing sensor histidine kinase [Candidatus Kapabacteria bacterium]|nr:HAMP domain-containing sensor histidine kinase [Candidatus Kapabacteria bacterium]